MSGTGNEQPTQILQFTPDSDVRIIGDTVLLVTHVSSTFDPDQSARDGINRSVHFARHHGIPLVYLIDSQETSSYYFDDWHPNYAVESAGGEFFFDLSTPHVLVAGGYLDQCLRTTVQTALRRIQAAKTELDLRLSLITDAIFEGALLSQTRTLQEWIREAQATGRESELISGLIRRLVRPPPETWT